MVMDRPTLLAIFLAIVGMILVAGLLFGGTTPAGEHARPQYAPGDVRYGFQQADAKKPKRKNSAPAKDQFVTDGSTTSRGNSDADVGEESAEPSEETSAEEPPLD